MAPLGAEVLAEWGFLDPKRRTLTKKGRVVHDALEAVARAPMMWGAKGQGEGR